MGACHTVPAILFTEKTRLERCLICWEHIPIDCTNYVKCVKCSIRLHPSCGIEYQKKYISDTLTCPNCKNVDSLFLYDNDVYSCL